MERKLQSTKPQSKTTPNCLDKFKNSYFNYFQIFVRFCLCSNIINNSDFTSNNNNYIKFDHDNKYSDCHYDPLLYKGDFVDDSVGDSRKLFEDDEVVSNNCLGSSDTQRVICDSSGSYITKSKLNSSSIIVFLMFILLSLNSVNADDYWKHYWNHTNAYKQWSSDNENCVAVPVSLSELNNCVNDYCTFSSVATVSLPNIGGATACFEFISPDGITSPFKMRFQLLESFFNFYPTAIYNADDPAYDITSVCNCQKTTTCYAEFPGLLDWLYVSPVMSTQSLCGAPSINTGLFDSGYYCYMIGFSGNSRFKVLKFGQTSNIIQQFKIWTTEDNSTYVGNYTGLPTAYSDPNGEYVINYLGNTGLPSINPEFIVFDRNDMSGFYFMSSSLVNDVTTYDPTKVGWYKPDVATKLGAQTTSQFTSFLQSCNGNVNLNFPWHWTADILTNNIGLFSGNIAPNAILVDPDFDLSDEANSIPTHHVEPYNYILNGFSCINTVGVVSDIGITMNGFVTPLTQQTGTFSNLYTNKGRLVNATANNQWFYSAPVYCSSIVPGQLENLQFHTFIMYQNLNYTEWAVTIDGNNFYNNIWVTVLQWPTNRYVNVSLNNGTFEIEDLPQNIYKKNYNPNTQLLIPSNGGFGLLQLTFNNLTVYFESNSIKPKIVSVRFIPGIEANFISIIANSITVSGLCYTGSLPPGIILTQKIELKVSENEYTYPIAVSKWSGDVTFYIRCAENYVSTEAFIDIDILPDNLNYTFENSTPAVVTSDDCGWICGFKEFWAGVGSVFTAFWDFIARGFDILGDLFGGSLWAMIAGWVIYIIVIAIIIVVIIMCAYACVEGASRGKKKLNAVHETFNDENKPIYSNVISIPTKLLAMFLKLMKFLIIAPFKIIYKIYCYIKDAIFSPIKKTSSNNSNKWY